MPDTPDTPPTLTRPEAAQAALEQLQTRYDTGDRDQHPPLESPAVSAPPVTPASAAAPSSAAQVKTYEHPTWLRDQALDLGYDPAEVDSVPSDVLGAEVRRVSKLLLQERRQDNRNSAVVDAARPNQPPTPAPQQQAPAPVKDPLDFELGEDIHPPIVEAINAIRAELRQLREGVKPIKETVNGVVQREHQREFRSKLELVDAAFASLGPDVESLIGQGGRADIGNDSPEFHRRVALLNAAKLNLSQTPFDQMPSLAVLSSKLKKAYETLFGSVATSSAQSPDESDPYGVGAGSAATPEPAPTRTLPPRNPRNGKFTKPQWDNGALNRPSHRSGGPGDDPTARAEAAVADLLAQRGQAEL